MSTRFPPLADTLSWSETEWASAARHHARMKDTHPLLGPPSTPQVRSAQASWMKALSAHPQRATAYLYSSQRLAWPVLLAALQDHGGESSVREVLAPQGRAFELEQGFAQAWSDMARTPWLGMGALLDPFAAIGQAVCPRHQVNAPGLLSTALRYADPRSVISPESERGQLIGWLWKRMDWSGQSTIQISAWLQQLRVGLDPAWGEALRSSIPPEIQLPVLLRDTLCYCPNSAWLPVVKEAEAALRQGRLSRQCLGSVLAALGLEEGPHVISAEQVGALACVMHHLGAWIPVDQVLSAYRAAAHGGHDEACALLAPHVPFGSPHLLPASELSQWLAERERGSLDRLLAHAPTDVHQVWIRLLPTTPDERALPLAQWPAGVWERLQLPRTQARVLAEARGHQAADRAPSRKSPRQRV